MSFDIFLACVGMVAGVAAFLLGVAQLTCEHQESGWMPRWSTALLAIASAWTAIDAWEAWAGVDGPVDHKVIVFVVILAVSWAHRRVYGLITDKRPNRVATSADLDN